MNSIRLASAAALASTLMGVCSLPAHAATTCSSDWRGDKVCVTAEANQLSASASDEYTGSIPYLEVANASDNTIVNGPVVDRTLRVTLPPGRYYVTYYVATTDDGDAQVDSSPVTVAAH